MIYLLLEQEGNVISPVEPEFVKRYDRGSIKRFSSDVGRADLAGLDTPPLFNNEWLIICNGLIKGIPYLYPDKNTVLLKVFRRSDLSKVMDRLSSSSFCVKVIDNYQIPKETVLGWIMSNLSVTISVAKTLYNQCSGSMKAIVTAVDVLKHCGVVTSGVITKNVPKAYSVNAVSFTQYLIGEQTKLTRYEVAQFLFDFRYAFDWLQKRVLEELQRYLDVFYAVDSGELRMNNFREFLKNTKIKSIMSCSEYRLSKMIEVHNYISTEKVYFLWLSVSVLPKGMSGVRGLLKLVKIGGYDEYDM